MDGGVGGVVTLPTVSVVEIEKPDLVVVVIVIGLATFFTALYKKKKVH